MGLTRRRDGYYVEFRVLDDGETLKLAEGIAGSRLRRWKTHSTNRTIAKQQEAIRKTELMKGIVKSDKLPPPMTFRAWAGQYLELDNIKRLRSYDKHVDIVGLRLIPYFGDKLLTHITPEDVEAYRAQYVLKNGTAPALSTINNDHAVLKQLLYEAVKKRKLESNPASKVTMPDPHNERDRVLTAEEWARLYAEAASHLKPILQVAYQLGLRYGEIVNLTWDRIDLKRGILSLTAHDTKTKKPRTVPLTPELTDVFRDLYKVRYLNQDRVFLRNGQSIRSIRTAFERATRRAGITNLRFHDLRHCAATNMRRAGVDVMTAMRIIGHTSEKMHKRYNTIDEHDLRRAASQINTYLTLAQQDANSREQNSAI
ncbi:site-specific integrase [Nitrospiraceae bacterium AH_259_D15_M11_P09]|nr:site-specific integrase [Nitrospiraceae bacterium AH_259_D15_M11_P09]